MKTTDKRVLARKKSKQKIYAALFELMEEKPYSSISISEIIDRSGVARSTFYRHFNSVYDVMQGYEHSLDERFAEETEGMTPNFTNREYLIATFNFYKSLASDFDIIYRVGLGTRWLNLIVSYHQKVMSNEIKDAASRYSVYYYGGALWATVLEWVSSGLKESPEELAEIFLGLVQGGNGAK